MNSNALGIRFACVSGFEMPTSFVTACLLLSLATGAVGQTIANGSFESPQIASSVVYSTTATSWSFSSVTGVSGISANGSAFTAQSPATTDGRQVALIQGEGFAAQSISASVATSCTASFIAEQRTENQDATGIRLSLELDSVAVWSDAAPYKVIKGRYTTIATSSFMVSAGSHTLRFHGRNPAANDNTVFIDSVALSCSAPAGFSNGGFEAPYLAGGYQYAPAGAVWIFNGAGITGNANAFTAGNPAAPQGLQVAFLQMYGTASQTAYINSGTYTLSLQAAQRGNYNSGSQVIRVAVDGAVVGQYQPPDTNYTSYKTSPFTISSTGNHTITLSGIGNGGSDFTAFVDNVQLVAGTTFYGFWDQGFTQPRIRTNYSSIYTGTSSSPLLFGTCPFADAFNGCPSVGGASVYAGSNAFSLNLNSFSDPQFWVLLMNNERLSGSGYNGPATTCNSGPPDNSLPRAAPGGGVFGMAPVLDSAAGENYYRMKLFLDLNFANPCQNISGNPSVQAISYMSIGAHSNRGNSSSTGASYALGAINASAGVPHSVAFKSRIYTYQEPTFLELGPNNKGALLFRLVFGTSWLNAQGVATPRQIQLNLFHDFSSDNGSAPARYDWNWPFPQDTFASGAEIVFFDAERVQAFCGFPVYRMTPSDLNREIFYDIDLQALFQCATKSPYVGTAQGFTNAWSPFSSPQINLVDWAVEGTGTKGALQVGVSNMVMH